MVLTSYTLFANSGLLKHMNFVAKQFTATTPRYDAPTSTFSGHGSARFFRSSILKKALRGRHLTSIDDIKGA